VEGKYHGALHQDTLVGPKLTSKTFIHCYYLKRRSLAIQASVLHTLGQSADELSRLLLRLFFINPWILSSAVTWQILLQLLPTSIAEFCLTIQASHIVAAPIALNRHPAAHLGAPLPAFLLDELGDLGRLGVRTLQFGRQSLKTMFSLSTLAQLAHPGHTSGLGAAGEDTDKPAFWYVQATVGRRAISRILAEELVHLFLKQI
jgi:hypothetical protein